MWSSRVSKVGPTWGKWLIIVQRRMPLLNTGIHGARIIFSTWSKTFISRVIKSFENIFRKNATCWFITSKTLLRKEEHFAIWLRKFVIFAVEKDDMFPMKSNIVKTALLFEIKLFYWSVLSFYVNFSRPLKKWNKMSVLYLIKKRCFLLYKKRSNQSLKCILLQI